jgi:hypothetical protein
MSVPMSQTSPIDGIVLAGMSMSARPHVAPMRRIKRGEHLVKWIIRRHLLDNHEQHDE